MTATKNGLFIVFEGGDGAGKSTQAGRLATFLTEQGYAVRTTFEPGDTALGAQMRQILLHSQLDPCPRAETLLYAVDKAQHVATVVRPALDDAQVVICDRYIDSTIAYQGAGRALQADEVARIGWWAVDNVVPDLTVLMDVTVGDGLASKEERDRMESAGEDFHERVRRHFLDLAAAQPERYLVVNGRDPKAEVTAQIRARVLELIDSAGFSLRRNP